MGETRQGLTIVLGRWNGKILYELIGKSEIVQIKWGVVGLKGWVETVQNEVGCMEL